MSSAGHLNRIQYPSDVIALVVLWRLRYRLTLRDLAEMFLCRGVVFRTALTLTPQVALSRLPDGLRVRTCHAPDALPPCHGLQVRRGA